ncbi:MAG: hypothetical protein GY932_12230 [Arcobacter sp.]|nr:hypothetical protein [Arcobacter sp.]
MRKGTFSVQNASANSSKHNSRELSPKYLIDSSAENYYEQIIEDNNFIQLAQDKYKELVKQNMQKKQIPGLIKETVLTIKDSQNENDIKDLFKELNKEFGGHHLTEISIHRDEGYFLKDEIAYYPTKNILKKDNDWFICSNRDITKPKKNDFDKLVNINDFEKVFNYHAHAKFSMFDMNTGKTARMNKGQMSKRIKFVSNYLGLDYNPSKDRHVKKSVNQIKDEHLVKANEKSQELAKQKDLKLHIAKAREELQNEKATRKDYAALEELNKNLKNEVKQKALTIEDLNEHIESLKHSLLNSKKENSDLQKSNNELREDINLKDTRFDNLMYIVETQQEELQEQKKVLDDKSIELGIKNVSRPTMNDYDYKNDISRIINVAIEENEYISKKGFLADTVKKVNEIKSPETLKDKFVSYFRDTYENLKEKYLDLKVKYSTLEKENTQLKKELSIYKPKELTAMQEIIEENKKDKLKDFFDKKRKDKEQNIQRNRGMSR